MALAAGTRIGSYEVMGSLGTGGMGEVYRARDLRLKRDVALKVLPEHVAADPDRVARFQREAEVLAAVNHPNIAHIYSVETAVSDDVVSSGPPRRALVMELVEGPTLADLIAGVSGSHTEPGLQAPSVARASTGRQGLPLDDVVAIAKQIAEALEAAHERGIVHRDLKPANIKVRPDGTVKVLDFGLAKAMAGGPDEIRPSGGALSESPTLTSPALMTGAGMVLGTAAYMSPEQVKGREADRRSDIWALGCVLYEMLAGRRLFDGDDLSEVFADVIKGRVVLDGLPPGTPASLRRILTRCLQKDRSRRLDSAVAVRLELEDVYQSKAPVAPAADGRMRARWAAAAVVALVVTIAGAAGGWFSRQPVSAPLSVIRFPVTSELPVAANDPFAISPDGRLLAFAAAGTDGTRRIWIRAMEAHDVRPIAGSENVAALPIWWSPDSRHIAFAVTGSEGETLKRVDVTGGGAQTICSVPLSIVGGSWNRDNVIIFGQNLGPPAVGQLADLVTGRHTGRVSFTTGRSPG